MTVWVCLLLFRLWPWRTPWPPGSRKHLLDWLELLICPFRNKSRNTVENTVITCSSSCSSMGKQRPGERIPANRWSVRKTRHRTLLLPEQVGGFPSRGDSPWPCFLCLCLLKGFTLSDSVPYLASRGAGPTGAAVLWAESKWRVTASASPHFGALKLHLHCLICFSKAQKWDSPVGRVWRERDANLGWLLPVGQGSAEHQGKGCNYELNP